MAPFLNAPAYVTASISSLGVATVDFAVNWVIDAGPHPGPYTVSIAYSKDSGAWTTLANYSYLAESTVHTGALYGHTYIYAVTWYCGDCDNSSSPGYSNVITSWGENPSDTVTMTDEVTFSESGYYISDKMTMTETINTTSYDTVTDTVTMTDTAFTATTLKTNYAYYLCDENGNIYAYSADSVSYGGSPITSYVKIKKTDFSDIHAVAADRFNTAYRARLGYIDKGQHFVTIYYSTDGGVTYTGVGKTIGTVAAPSKASIAIFDFVATGQYFNFKVESSTTTGTFQWISLDIDFSLGGEFFVI